jgi:hypothetical protein
MSTRARPNRLAALGAQQRPISKRRLRSATRLTSERRLAEMIIQLFHRHFRKAFRGLPPRSGRVLDPCAKRIARPSTREFHHGYDRLERMECQALRYVNNSCE